MNLRFVIFIIGTLFCSVAAHAEKTAEQWVLGMVNSARVLNYEGYFTYERGAQRISYQIYHFSDGEQEKQRLVFLDGEPREIIDDGHSLKCIHPGGQNFPAPSLDALALLSDAQQTVDSSIWKYYQAEVVAEERVAGRDVVRVDLKPKDMNRYPYVFYLDKETGLMLKMITLDTERKPLERFHYVSIVFDDVSEEELQPGIDNYVLVDHGHPQEPDASKTSEESAWHLAWLPGGFKLEPQIFSKSVNAQFVYSDGLSAFSVFIEEVDAGQQLIGSSKQTGATSAVSQFVSVGKQVFRVTVIGEVPLMTAKQIAMSVRMQP